MAAVLLPGQVRDSGVGERLPESLVLLVLLASSLPGLAILSGIDLGVHAPRNAPLYLPAENISQLHLTLRGSFLHTLLEWSGVMIALVYATFSMLDYRLRQDPVTLIIGVALLCAATTDVFHTLAADRIIMHVTDHASFIPFTWAISRISTMLVLLVGLVLLLRARRNANVRPVLWFGAIALFLSLLTSRLSIGALSLPEVQLTDAWVSRPFDVIPLFLYSTLLPYLAWRLDQRESNFVSHALLLSMIPAVMTQIHMAFGSDQLFDAHFNAGHFLKAFSYMVPLAGLIAEYGSVSGKLKQRESALAEQASILAHSNRRLYLEIQERENAEQKLRDQAERLRMSNEELEQFAFIASHDLREPLRKILIYSSRLERNPLINEDQKVRAIVDSVAGAGRRMMVLLESLQQYTSVSAQDHAREEVALNEILRDVCQTLAPQVEAVGARLQIEDLPVLSGVNRAQMISLFQHLLENALIYHTTEQTPEVHVRALETEDADWVRIQIQDNGPGIDPRFQEKVFQIFQRLEPDQQAHRTGAGLTLCRRICHRHGGTLTLESQPGEGCCFHVLLPVRPNR